MVSTTAAVGTEPWLCQGYIISREVIETEQSGDAGPIVAMELMAGT